MKELTKDEVRGLDHINPPGLDKVEPLPILLPPS
jgi:hypothetical protein